jgi:hypothetical protein
MATVGDIPSDLDPIPEPLDRLTVERDLRPNELERHFLIELPVIDPIAPHPPAAQLFEEFPPGP